MVLNSICLITLFSTKLLYFGDSPSLWRHIVCKLEFMIWVWPMMCLPCVRDCNYYSYRNPFGLLVLTIAHIRFRGIVDISMPARSLWYLINNSRCDGIYILSIGFGLFVLWPKVSAKKSLCNCNCALASMLDVCMTNESGWVLLLLRVDGGFSLLLLRVWCILASPLCDVSQFDAHIFIRIMLWLKWLVLDMRFMKLNMVGAYEMCKSFIKNSKMFCFIERKYKIKK